MDQKVVYSTTKSKSTITPIINSKHGDSSLKSRLVVGSTLMTELNDVHNGSPFNHFRRLTNPIVTVQVFLLCPSWGFVHTLCRRANMTWLIIWVH